MTTYQAKWFIPIMLFLLIAPFSVTIDHRVADYFYSIGQGFSTHPLFEFSYHYAIYPGWILLFSGVVMFALSLVWKKYRHLRVHGVYLLLTFIIGAGVITHLLLKDMWGRPRPRQTIEYGGTQEFRPFYSPNFFQQPEPSKSFPCGHCTMGFYFFSLAVVGRRMNKSSLVLLGYACAAILGVGLSLTRISQGGHWLTDTMVTALVMWYTSLFFEYYMYGNDK